MSKYILPFLNTEPGQKRLGFVRVVGTEQKLPYTCIRGNTEGKTICIVAGIEETDYAAMEAAKLVRDQLQPQQVCGNVIIVTPLFQARQKDGHKKGDTSGCVHKRFDDKLVHFVTENFIRRCDYYIEMHSGNLQEHIAPTAFYPEGNLLPEHVQAISALCFPYAVPAPITCEYAAFISPLECPSISTVCGSQGRWNPIESQAYAKAILQILTAQNVYRGNSLDYHKITWTEAPESFSSAYTGMWYPQFEVGQHVRAGEKLGEITDFFGKVLEEILAPYDSVVLRQTTQLTVKKDAFLLACTAIAESPPLM